MIAFRNVAITLGNRNVLNCVSLDIKKGEIFCIIGRSGAGKSVMIKQLVGLLHPNEGSIQFEGQEVTTMKESERIELRRKCGMVFQHATLFDSISCIENVVLPIRKHQGLRGAPAREKALQFMAQAGVAHLAERDPATLGPGLRKLVAIARTLTMQPHAILFDEPTTGLDPLAARKFDRLVKGPLAQSGITQVLVSHDVRSVFDVATRLAMLHEGKIRFIGTPQQLLQSRDPVLKSFIEGRPDLMPETEVST
ncbi:MAG: ATP-binding cassette domain-containing protein [Myxococcales bacterium]|jgi:phospholipid/cholesterol/gamma-HCH transport system ATP-binding protein|nr:ATP-binding cassette domain-containing protein [Myxococcales bacterium]